MHMLYALKTYGLPSNNLCDIVISTLLKKMGIHSISPSARFRNSLYQGQC